MHDDCEHDDCEAYDEYHALLARRDAMRLRRRLLAPRRQRPSAPRPGACDATASPYDGAADQQVITRHLPLVSPLRALIDHLYAAMFEQHPYLRGLFPASMEFQRAHLERAFRYLIENLHRPDEVAAFCARLGRDHRKLGVLPVHYEVFEAALAEGLRRRAGERWTEELEQAWLRMLRFAVAAMVAGADRAMAEPPYWNAEVTEHHLRRPDLAVLRVRTAEPYPYRAGQYARLQSPLLPHAWRPYTVACAPRPGGELEFHIRRTGPGGLSQALVAHTHPGDALRLGPPQGTMTLDDNVTRDVLIVAAGTGWATAKALLEELAARRTRGRTARLFLGARSREDLYDGPELARLTNRCPWLRVTPVIGGSAVDPAAPAAAVYDPLAEAVARHGDWSGHLAYVSGPPAMVTAVLRRLAARNLPADRIRHSPALRPQPAR
ncbi:flavohemoprotein [Streptomyces piniterrae]|uniref:nitric oxide dioxygenase n=1 Tax=Streptomyces piniterrae TaxID=2571125 RepID=A0A4U0NYL6_9ACTN|nr:globin domain-containing protein [Streptomyces piniterrae]TJZ59302.1 flavohemoprotein [Streptomyces piniterrae]